MQKKTSEKIKKIYIHIYIKISGSRQQTTQSIVGKKDESKKGEK